MDSPQPKNENTSVDELKLGHQIAARYLNLRGNAVAMGSARAPFRAGRFSLERFRFLTGLPWSSNKTGALPSGLVRLIYAWPHTISRKRGARSHQAKAPSASRESRTNGAPDAPGRQIPLGADTGSGATEQLSDRESTPSGPASPGSASDVGGAMSDIIPTHAELRDSAPIEPTVDSFRAKAVETVSGTLTSASTPHQFHPVVLRQRQSNTAVIQRVSGGNQRYPRDSSMEQSTVPEQHEFISGKSNQVTAEDSRRSNVNRELDSGNEHDSHDMQFGSGPATGSLRLPSIKATDRVREARHTAGHQPIYRKPALNESRIAAAHTANSDQVAVAAHDSVQEQSVPRPMGDRPSNSKPNADAEQEPSVPSRIEFDNRSDPRDTTAAVSNRRTGYHPAPHAYMPIGSAEQARSSEYRDTETQTGHEISSCELPVMALRREDTRKTPEHFTRPIYRVENKAVPKREQKPRAGLSAGAGIANWAPPILKRHSSISAQQPSLALPKQLLARSTAQKPLENVGPTVSSAENRGSPDVSRQQNPLVGREASCDPHWETQALTVHAEQIPGGLTQAPKSFSNLIFSRFRNQWGISRELVQRVSLHSNSSGTVNASERFPRASASERQIHTAFTAPSKVAGSGPAISASTIPRLNGSPAVVYRVLDHRTSASIAESASSVNSHLPPEILSAPIPARSSTVQRSMAHSTARTEQPLQKQPVTPAFSAGGSQGLPSLNISQLADQVYDLLTRRLAKERERRGV